MNLILSSRSAVVVSGLFFGFALVGASSCGRLSSDPSEASSQETVQAVSEVMVSLDEMGGSAGSYALRASPKAFWLIPSAYAAVCTPATTFAACSGTNVTRTFSGCTLGSFTVNGSITLDWGGAATTCSLGADGDTITRVPSFNIQGVYGGKLTVSKSGATGQVLTRTSSSSFSFASDGIRRVVTGSDGTVYLDFTTSTTSPIIVTDATPATRVGRSVNAGTLRVANNLSNVTCDYTPSNLAWANNCNCPVSGSWSGNCSDGRTSSLLITGCGTAQFSVGADNGKIRLQRCEAI